MSKAGVGVSVGVPGFRAGSGPRGNYVKIGGSGVHYRASPGPGTLQTRKTPQATSFDVNPIVMTDVTGATVIDMPPSSGDEVVRQLNSAARYFSWAWAVTIVAFVIGAATLPWGLLIWGVAAPVCYWMFLRDAAKRKVVLFYDVNDTAAEWFEALVDEWTGFSTAQKLWRTVASGDVETLHQRKTNAGASALVERIDAAASLGGPKHLASNIAIPSISAGVTSLYFLPDRVLLRQGKVYSDVSYRFLDVQGQQQRFIESTGVTPSDSKKVGETWKYVNKNGGPDRRFANNSLLPIMLYSNLTMTSSLGLSWRIQCSRPHAALELARVLEQVPTIRTDS